jgi:hypothetical protein
MSIGRFARISQSLLRSDLVGKGADTRVSPLPAGSTADGSLGPRVLDPSPSKPGNRSGSLAPAPRSCPEAARVVALEHVCRMRGGSQAQLLRCAEQSHYVVKFQNNPQGVRILANELLGTLLARRLGLPVPEVAIVDVCRGLIAHTDEMVIELRQGSTPLRPGLCFGSRYPHGAGELSVVYDRLPDECMARVENLTDFAGALVFDVWTCNTDHRQALFVRDRQLSSYRALMIDQGGCFNGAKWDFPDFPLGGLYLHPAIRTCLRRDGALEPWLERLEQEIDELDLTRAAEEIPPKWYGCNETLFRRLLDQLNKRRPRVRSLIS